MSTKKLFVTADQTKADLQFIESAFPDASTAEAFRTLAEVCGGPTS